jgi:hypothetical protein
VVVCGQKAGTMKKCTCTSRTSKNRHLSTDKIRQDNLTQNFRNFSLYNEAPANLHGDAVSFTCHYAAKLKHHSISINLHSSASDPLMDGCIHPLPSPPLPPLPPPFPPFLPSHPSTRLSSLPLPLPSLPLLFLKGSGV